MGRGRGIHTHAHTQSPLMLTSVFGNTLCLETLLWATSFFRQNSTLVCYLTNFPHTLKRSAHGHQRHAPPPLPFSCLGSCRTHPRSGCPEPLHVCVCACAEHDKAGGWGSSLAKENLPSGAREGGTAFPVSFWKCPPDICGAH